MINIGKIVYTLEYDTEEISDQAPVDYNYYLMHKEFLSTLSGDAAQILTNVLMLTATYIIESSRNKKYNYDSEVKRLLGADNADFIKRYENRDKLKLVEWIFSHDCKSYVTCSYRLSNNIIKSIMLHYLLSHEMSIDNLRKIFIKYNLVRYYPKLQGTYTKSIRFEYIKQYNHYLREFYIRSGIQDEDYLKKLDNAIIYNYYMMGKTYKRDQNINFEIILKRYDSIDSALDTIDAYFKSIKMYVERCYEWSTPEEFFLSRSGKGNKHYLAQFRKWKRYLKIYDLYQEYENRGEKVKSPQLDKIGKAIVKGSNVFGKYAITDLRKEIVKGYNEALRLIELSKTGVIN